MLIKKDLLKISLCAVPKLPAKDLKHVDYIATAKVVAAGRCRRILAADIFSKKDKSLALRFFCDGKNFICCRQWPATEWVTRKPGELISGYYTVASDPDSESNVKKFFGKQYSWYSGIMGYIDGFVSERYADKQRATMERKYAKMKDHFAMFPQLPAEIPGIRAYCDTHVFSSTYFFVSKLNKGKRDVVCGHCRRRSKVGREVRLGSSAVCPRCGKLGVYRGNWVGNTKIERAKLCIPYKVENQLLLEWTNIERNFIGGKADYCIWPYYRKLDLIVDGKPTEYSYCFMNPMGYYGWDWFRKTNGDTCHDEAYIYTPNLETVFGHDIYRVDLPTGIKPTDKLSFAGLLRNLKHMPSAEYLFKLGLTRLASEVDYMEIHKGKGFAGALGVSRQYLPLYRKYNVTRYEHRVIQAVKTWVSETDFMKFRELGAERANSGTLFDLLETMSFTRFVNYFTAQKAVVSPRKRKIENLLMYYRDYISMSKEMGVDLSHKSVRFPKNIKAAHDLIIGRYNQVKHAIEDEKFSHAIEMLYAGMKEYAANGYRIIFPTSPSEFITEGQTLNHCVGQDSYYKRHLKGKQMVFFIRQSEYPDKPFFTMEVDMQQLRIMQLYGFGDCSAPPEVRKFANMFLRQLKPERMVS